MLGVYNCCMLRRDALRAKQQHLQIDNPTQQQITLYHDCCKIACETVTRETELVVLSACRHWNIECVVAPGEADAQVVYEAKVRNAPYVISNDCDLMVSLSIAGFARTPLF